MNTDLLDYELLVTLFDRTSMVAHLFPPPEVRAAVARERDNGRDSELACIVPTMLKYRVKCCRWSVRGRRPFSQ